jgi:hypothetical protein
MKMASYPFDWVDIRNETNVLHCLKDDFNIFMDKSYYQPFEPGKRRHSYYSYKFFNHKDPMKDEDYNYYKRCISRFKEMLSSGEKKLFMLGFFNLEAVTDERRQELLYFNKEFSDFTSNYTLLVILHRVGEEIKHSVSNIDNVCFLELETKTPSNGLLFKTREENDYLESVINTLFNFDLKKYYDSSNKRSA